MNILRLFHIIERIIYCSNRNVNSLDMNFHLNLRYAFF